MQAVWDDFRLNIDEALDLGDRVLALMRVSGRGPGHAPEALEDSEYVDFSPSEQFRRVIHHITSGAT